MNRYSHRSALISAILPASAGVGLDQEVVELRGDLVGVLGDERREQVGRADGVETTLRSGRIAARQHESDRTLTLARGPVAGPDDRAR